MNEHLLVFSLKNVEDNIKISFHMWFDLKTWEPTRRWKIWRKRRKCQVP